jgi:hypothetical protein
MAKQPEILDLDKLIGDKRIIKLAGKEIDVSKIPSKVTLRIADSYEDLKEDNPESMNILMDIVMDIIKPKNPEVTQDWIIENTDIKQLIALIEFIMKPVNERIKKGGPKN